jgi:hypothetical protein
VPSRGAQAYDYYPAGRQEGGSRIVRRAFSDVRVCVELPTVIRNFRQPVVLSSEDFPSGIRAYGILVQNLTLALIYITIRQKRMVHFPRPQFPTGLYPILTPHLTSYLPQIHIRLPFISSPLTLQAKINLKMLSIFLLVTILLGLVILKTVFFSKKDVPPGTVPPPGPKG